MAGSVAGVVGLLVCGPLAISAQERPAATACGEYEEPRFPWQKFPVGGTCVEISNQLSGVYQDLMQSRGSIAAPVRPGSASSDNPAVKTLTFSPSLVTTTPTGLGDLGTSFGLSISRSSDDSDIRVTLSEAQVTLGGLTVGYLGSVMNFWSGDFQFAATVPSRTVGVARYEYPISANAKLGLSLETGVPTSSPPPDEFAPIYEDDPVVAARWLYETDPLTLNLAAMAHELKFDRTNTRFARLAGQPDSVTGWAATAGATIWLPALGDDDNVSAQATYAVNASPYLGTSSDLSTLASVVPFNIETRGWSVVASYHRAWSEQWETNVFGSALGLDISTPRASPSVRSLRFAANVIFIPVRDVRLGAELGYLDLRFALNGPGGILSGGSGQQLTGYLFAEVSF